MPVLEGTNITASFDASGELSGFGSCNSYSATYSEINGSIFIVTITSTNQLCEDVAGIMEQEVAYFTVLPTAVTFQANRGQLSLNNSAGQNIAVYQELVVMPLSIR